MTAPRRLVIAFDPGNSTGWCVIDGNARRDAELVVDSGQCDFADCMAHVFEIVGTDEPEAIAVEKPVIVPGRGGFGNAGSALETAWKAGCLFGRCVTLWTRPKMWQPRPAEWRAKLGVGKGSGNTREGIARNVCAWVKVTTGIDCGDGSSEDTSEVDRAMAIALACSTLYTVVHGAEARA